MSELGLEWEAYQRHCMSRADNCGEQIGAKIDILLPVLQQTYARSENSALSFSMPDGVNYFKKAGIVCYWLRKLKPFSVRIDHENSHVMNDKLINFPVNECIAAYVAIDLIFYAHEKALFGLEDQDYADQNEAQMNLNRIRFRKIEKDFVHSLRYFVFSAGSLPLFFEAAFRIPLDDQYAFHE